MRPKQKDTAQDLYQEALQEVHRLQIQCLLQEIEPLLLSGGAVLAKAMLLECKQSAEFVWEDVAASENPCSRRCLPPLLPLEETASKSSSLEVTPEGDGGQRN